jgi:hypothetical protein
MAAFSYIVPVIAITAGTGAVHKQVGQHAPHRAAMPAAMTAAGGACLHSRGAMARSSMRG